ncbi:hypothetical protein [Novosphingobium sp.]|uniref:hypothetical protein n=1 Tax=Novosphingobium sp. TaxID=1874826 RepID=UPI00333E2EF7
MTGRPISDDDDDHDDPMPLVATPQWAHNHGADPQIGVRASALGSFLPEGSYRPIPIVWLVAAWVGHSFAMVTLVAVLSGFPLLVTIGATVLVSLWIGNKAFAAGMAHAATGWKIATVAALLINWALAATTAAALAGY